MCPAWNPAARLADGRSPAARTRAALEDALDSPAMARVVALPPEPAGSGRAASGPADPEAADTRTGNDAAARNAPPDVLVVPMAVAAAEEGPAPQPRGRAAEAAIAYGVDVAARAEAAGITGKAGDILTAEAPAGKAGPDGLAGRLMILGLGEGSAGNLRKAGAALAKATFGTGTVRADLVDVLDEAGQRAFVEGFLLGGYRPPRAGTAEAPKPMAAALELPGASAAAVDQAAGTAEAVWLARSLGNMPSNIKNPEWMAGQCRRVAAGAGLQVRVWDEKQLAAEGFGGLLAVGSASGSAPRFVQLSYTPRQPDAGSRHIVLLGKGITFDTGGVSLKPREAMVPMKLDMAGAAAVLAAVSAAERLGVRHRVTVLLALAENSMGAASYRPGDVVSAYGGTTIEIGNTDAEGRLVLADGLAYAAATLAPDVLVDVATLTGAAALGLGRRQAALFSNTPALAEAFRQAGAVSGEPVWQLPLAEDYVWGMESRVADLSHIPPVSAKMGGGAIFAALFLREFVGRTPWVHLDIAGPAEASADAGEQVKGATGYGTRLLLSFLNDWE